MYRQKSLIRRLIPWLIAAAVLACLIIFVFVPIYSQKEELNEEQPVIAYYEGNEKALTMENEDLVFTMDPMTTRFQVVEKATGRTWDSTPKDADKDPIALTANKEALGATLLIGYTTSSGEITLNNNAYSMANQTYQLNKQDDGSIRVDYAIGQIERVFMLPSAITKERFTAFTDAMSKKNKKQTTSNYSLYEPEKLDKKDNKDEIIAMYPSVQEQALYILKSDVSSTNKQKLEGYFAEAGYTQEDFEIDQQLVAGKSETSGPVFNVSVIYRLEGKDLVVEIPYSEIKYKSDYPITSVTPLPMFGAAGTDQEGFLFVPEGGGALIRFNNGKLYQSAYYANLYGWDYGVQRKEAVSETENAFPVFGATHDGGSFLCMIEGASAYAGINADISGRNNSYNTINAKYSVLHAEQYNVSAKTTQLVYVYEKEIPQDTVIQRYRFVDSDDYSDMAKVYGDYLRERHPELAAATASEETPVHVELVGAINKNVIKFGVPVDSVVPTTTFEQAQSILDELTDSGVHNLNIRMTGWMNGGVRQKVLTGVHVLGELGGQKAMDSLIAEAQQKNVQLSFDGITAFAYNSGLFDGFLPFRDAARFATREQVHLYPYSIVTYQQADWLYDYYLTRPGYAQKNTTNLINYLQERKAAGIAFRDNGNLLSADYYPKDLVTREKVKQMNLESLAEAKEKGLKVTIKEGNEYAVPYADLITDMNLTGQAYAIIDEQIPFYQMALHGMKDFTGEAINLAGDCVSSLLECAEYGTGLNFTFIAENTKILLESYYSCYTSAGYEYWKDQALSMILRYQEEMRGLNSQRIAHHERIADEVTMTTYEDGTEVYVNYGSNDFRKGTVQVPARDYLVKRGNEK